MKTVVAVFDSLAEAERAAELLLDEGFQRNEIEVRSQAVTEEETGAESGSWWAWLFGESEDRSIYSESIGRGRALVAVTTADARAEGAREILQETGAPVDTSAGSGTARSEDSPTRAGEGETLPVVEEQLRVGKRPVARGGVRMYSRVEERPVQEQVPLRQEHVRVTRRPADRPLRDEEARTLGEQEIEITETGEEPVVAKEARVVEEVAIDKDVEERVETVHDTVRRRDVEVERIGGEAAATTAPAEKFGATLASDPAFGATDWSATAPEARRMWESRNPGTWHQFEETIRRSWERARQGRRAA